MQSSQSQPYNVSFINIRSVHTDSNAMVLSPICVKLTLTAM
jgi:hypothetical protein